MAIASRTGGDTAELRKLEAMGVRRYACDAADNDAVGRLFASVTKDCGAFPSLVVFNPSGLARGPVTDLNAEAVKQGLLVSAYGGFNVAQHAARGMVAQGHGSILFTGASASYKGYANSSSFAMGKFGLHGLAQSLARELGPKGVHVAHFPIDGGIGRLDDNGEKTSHWARYAAIPGHPMNAPREASELRKGTNGDFIDDGDTMLHPMEIAKTYLFAHRQHRSAWTFEFQLRPYVEQW